MDISKLFNNYTPYILHSTGTDRWSITIHGVKTGEIIERKYEIYRKTHKRTGLPKYKKIYLPE